MSRIINLPLTVNQSKFLYSFLWSCKPCCKDEVEKMLLNAVIMKLNEEICR